MRHLRTLAAALSVAALAIAVPAVAKPSHPTTSHKCTAHKVAYRAHGTLVSFSGTQTGKDRYTGTIVVHVTNANHHAKADKNNDVTYPLDNTVVKFGRGTSSSDTSTSNDRVTVIGKITQLAKKCDQTGFTPTVTARQVYIHRASGTTS